VTFRPRFVAALMDPHYVACIAAMPDAADILGLPHAVYLGPAGVHWVLTTPPTSLLDSPAATLPWEVYEHSYVEWAGHRRPPEYPGAPEPGGYVLD
jgi:hypothetical protein